MPKTNKERLQDNNLELQSIKTGIDNLPEYQDIEPIYANENLSLKQLNLAYSSNITFISSLDDKYISYYNYISSGPQYNHCIGRINNDGTVTNLYSRYDGSNGGQTSIELLDYDDEYLYIYDRKTNYGQQRNGWKIQRFDLSTKTIESSIYYTAPIEYNTYHYGESSFNNLGNGYVQMDSYNYPIYKLDAKNKTCTKVITFTNKQGFKYVFTSNIIASESSSGGTHYTVFKNLTTGAERKMTMNIKEVNAILFDNSMIVKNNNLYVFNEDLSIGALVKENVIEDYAANNTMLLNIYPSYYMDYLRGKLYYFNNSTNVFEKVLNTSGVWKQNQYNYKNYLAKYCINNGFYNIVEADNTNNIIGYKYNNVTMMLPSGITSSTDKLLTGSYLYNKFNVGVSGTMPNNGALNYTPTTSQQTIPQGYTSGGTISAVTSAIDQNILPENIKKDVTILGVTGTLEEGGSTSIILQDGVKFGGSSFEELPDYIANADFSQVTDFDYMFSNCTHLYIIPLIDTSNAISMQGMFSDSNLDEVPLLDTSNVTNMSIMFAGNGFLYEIPQFDTSNVTTMRRMFEFCMMLETVPILDTSNVTDFKDMFSDCRNLSDESLNNIMQMCINASSYTGTKTLKEIGLTSEYATKCQTLSNWSSFVEEGWTKGY